MSEGSVVPIRPSLGPVYGSDKEADAGFIKELVDLWEMAKAGEIVGVAYVALHPGDLTSYTTIGRTTRGVLGALTLLQHSICRDNLENT